MKWILGVDLRARCGGALRFGAWLSSVAPGEALVPVHALEEEHLLLLLRFQHLDEVLAETRAAAERAIAGAGCAGRVPEPRIVQGRRAEEVLAHAAEAESAGAIVVGRIARRGAHPMVRLGRVARRLVRHLPAPVVLVPPDLEQLGRGPVVALVSLEPDSLRACRFARDLARAVSRPLAVLHAVPDPADAGPYGLPGAAVAQLRADTVLAARERLDGWLAAADVVAETAEVRVGDPAEQALALGVERDAAVAVTGATRRHAAQRLYAPSVGRALACAAPWPVAIVPPDGA
jgi:nucleotide-binding universal stress UspA family protein